ncbi:hypothetical protein Misp01_05870 [Microtetraspora sp. NBRC 13810]|uniref:pentapeptide repeat-containing protein n=1 Tax=Microtetraspora sp. NBRC 13810 TaxID=3030990 RepID=UPI0024A55217|nr:pentapeptide repeat-containing protein [Microtetraspora sp. NBRC 13810]GLW05457.1 hypothetical protein Misp01_05870 [Microtetraspora sp. NBRC 13810]
MRRPIPLALSTAVAALVAVTWLPAAATAATAAAGPCRPGQGADLRGKDFTKGRALPDDLRCANLTKARLDGLPLVQKDLTGAILRDASLKETNLTQAHLEYADLRGANLTEADLGQLQADHADLRKAVLVDADAGQAEFPHADLTGARLTRAELAQADFTDAKLVGADLTDASPGQIKARKADFTRAVLREAKLGQAELQHATFKDADLRETEFTQADLDGADFTGAQVQDASFSQADDLDLTGAKGTPQDVPAEARGVPSADPVIPAIGDLFPGGLTGEDPRGAEDGAGGLSAGLVLVILSAVGLALTALLWAGSYRRRTRAAAAFGAALRAAEEDVTRLGEEIDRLDYEFQLAGTSGGMSADREWRYALDAYEAAKNALAGARSREQLLFVTQAVRDGRAALDRLRGHDRLR